MKVVIKWFRLFENCTRMKITKEHGEDVRVCSMNRYKRCRPDCCPLLEDV